MERTFEYRIYPDREQQKIIAKTFGCGRWVWNRVLSMRQEEYTQGRKQRRINSYITEIPKWKKGEAPWLSEADSMALQQSLRDLDKAYRNFFRSPGKTGFPKFKSKHSSKQSYRTNNIEIPDAKHVKLPKLGIVKARISRPCEGRILSVTVKLVPSGKYFIEVCCTECPKHEMPAGKTEIMGIDAGIHDLMVRSDGVKSGNPRNIRKSEKRLAKEQRKLSRKQKGSANREKQRKKVALIHEKTANKRKDFLNKITTTAVSESQAIAVEDLNIRGMQKNRRLSKAISDVSISEMTRQLEYKCEWYDRKFVKVDRFYPSSQLCSCCGYRESGVKDLSVREWVCPNCGIHNDRDLKAARNIAAKGKRILESTVGHTETLDAIPSKKPVEQM